MLLAIDIGNTNALFDGLTIKTAGASPPIRAARRMNMPCGCCN
jgi:pantothenate kinase type III